MSDRTGRIAARAGRLGTVEVNYPLRHSPNDCYIGRIGRSREGGNLASLPPCPV